jgi:hypothetical protein
MRGKVKEIAYQMAKKKEDARNETIRRATAKHAQENEQDDSSMKSQEPPDKHGGREIQESPMDLPRLRKLLKGSIFTNINALRLRSLRDESFKIIKERQVVSILVDLSTYVMGPSTETPFDEDTINQICGFWI